MRKFIKNSTLFTIMPILLAFLVSKIIKIELPILIVMFYGVLLFFLIPSDIYFGSTLDYNTKVINHTYRPEKKKFEDGPKNDIYYILIVVICIMITFLVWYFFGI